MGELKRRRKQMPKQKSKEMRMQKPRKNPWKLLTQKRMVVMRNNTGIIDVKTKHSKTIHTSRTYFRAVCRYFVHFNYYMELCRIAHLCDTRWERLNNSYHTHNISKELTQLNYYTCNFILIMKLHGVSSR